MDDKSFKLKVDKVFDSDLFKVLSEKIRCDILKYLVIHGECDVAEISANFSQDRSVISRHLKRMNEAGILKSEKKSRNVFYRADGISFLARLETLTDVVRELLVYKCDECIDIKEKK